MIGSGQTPIRVLVVDDSRVAAQLLSDVLNADPRIRVVRVATNGEQALEAAVELQPDVITMDVHMPKLNGYDATRRIMETVPTPIVIVSATTAADRAAASFRAIEAGALAFVHRPEGYDHPDHERSAQELTNSVRLMSEIKVIRRWPRVRAELAKAAAETRAARPSQASSAIQLVAIGASTGGPLALKSILSGLPANFGVPVVIAQHMAPGFAAGFVEWLGQASKFPVRLAVSGESLCPGQAYVAPDRFHIGVRPASRVLLTASTKEDSLCPSVNFLFASVVETFGESAVGVLLTGMGRDGVDEMKRMKAAGAVTIAQDEPSSIVHGMPGKAISEGAADYVCSPDEIVRALVSRIVSP